MSFGGLYARHYAQRFPDEVAGLVLVEPEHEDYDSYMPQKLNELYQAWDPDEELPDEIVQFYRVAHAGTGKTWPGTSGEYSLSKKHPVMAKVLAGVTQVEEWPVTACGEVAAMNAYLNSAGITDVSKIPRDTLYFHAQTWNAMAGKWQARSGCGNCRQWVTKIGAAWI
ncbi:alpha/beta fold hydrolase [Streptosporangium sp. NPDC002607]